MLSFPLVTECFFPNGRFLITQYSNKMQYTCLRLTSLVYLFKKAMHFNVIYLKKTVIFFSVVVV